MKVVVVYTSQTGNTEKIAYAIRRGVELITGKCDIFKMKEANPRRLYEYDLIGVGAPTHHSREPAWVSAFINNMRFLGGKHCFVFSTHGTLPSNFFASIIPKLKAKGLAVIGWKDWYGGGNHAQYPGPWYTEGHPDGIDLKEAEEFGREMIIRSVKIHRGETNLIPKKVPAMIDYGDLAPERVFKDAPHPRDYVKFEKEKCLYPACKLCMENCPWDGIDITVDPPILHKPCTYCGGLCEALCPTGAINWDAWREAKKIYEEKNPDAILHIDKLARASIYHWGRSNTGLLSYILMAV
ncbi:MAG: EFR1 family ferrodoxin [Candidatus Bathyarchaeia archaeon]